MIGAAVQVGAACLLVGGVLGFLGGWKTQEDRVQEKELALLMLQGMQREAESQADARVTVAQEKVDIVYLAWRESINQRQEDLSAFNAELDKITDRNRIALSADTVRLLNTFARSRPTKEGQGAGKPASNPAAAPAADGRYFAASENALAKWVNYAMSKDELSRAQIGALVAIICSRRDVFEIVDAPPGVFVCE